ncbi:hypothetical protein [Nocardia sp. NBC_00511]|uniref:hypothetical protein n=1 Tax=Nocardia sp. NBC_00511 TaxID=2903591 RepID=UPI002F90EC96
MSWGFSWKDLVVGGLGMVPVAGGVLSGVADAGFELANGKSLSDAVGAGALDAALYTIGGPIGGHLLGPALDKVGMDVFKDAGDAALRKLPKNNIKDFVTLAKENGLKISPKAVKANVLSDAEKSTQAKLNRYAGSTLDGALAFYQDLDKKVAVKALPNSSDTQAKPRSIALKPSIPYDLLDATGAVVIGPTPE